MSEQQERRNSQRFEWRGAPDGTKADMARDLAAALAHDDTYWDDELASWWSMMREVKRLATEKNRWKNLATARQRPASSKSESIHLHGTNTAKRVWSNGSGGGSVKFVDEHGVERTVYFDAIAAMQMRVALREFAATEQPTTDASGRCEGCFTDPEFGMSACDADPDHCEHPSSYGGVCDDCGTVTEQPLEDSDG